jgi:hypothetical protein
MVSGTSMFLLRALGCLGLGALLALCGAIYFLRAPEHAEMIAQRLSTLHPFWRLWLPPRFWTSGILLLQLRVTAAGVVLIGILLILSAFFSLVYHP